MNRTPERKPQLQVNVKKPAFSTQLLVCGTFSQICESNNSTVVCFVLIYLRYLANSLLLNDSFFFYDVKFFVVTIK